LASLPQCTVLAEATSNLDDAASVPCIDRTIEGLGGTADHDLKPDLLITFGGDVVSKRIKGLLRSWRPERHWHVDVEQRHHDTHQSLTHAIAVHPAAFLEQVAVHASALDSGYAARWRTRAQQTAARQAAFLAQAPWCDLTAFASILRALPAGSDVHLANSTPARYAQLFDRDPSLRWFANRGTSGIDGCVSTAVGAAFATQRPTTLICGETAFLYDSNAFWNAHLPAHLRVIVMDNGGGNIFRYIPGPDSLPELLPWFEAPHGRDPAVLARSFGLPTYEAGDGPSLQRALQALFAPHDRPAVLVVRTDAEVSPRVLRDHFAALRG
jgi:2-succinyl-5-enolpyruvyl-6-hydroxy-3-cyclohexene-1-carboxylate synthase